jgi:hypothetical protein
MRLYSALLLVLLSPALVTISHAHEGEEHGNHDALHDGFVLMYQDIHFEVVAGTEGLIRVFYTDAVRAELPAATVSDMAVEIEFPDGRTVPVNMAISDGGDYWEGMGTPITDPKTIIRLGFVFGTEPLLLDVPFSAMPEPAAIEMDTAMTGQDMPADSMPMDHSGH